MTPREINDRLVNQIDSVLSHLLPQGKHIGGEYCVGSLSGEPGNSLKVRVKGGKAGLWADFATGTDKGDLLELWCKVRRLGLPHGMTEACDWLGIKRGMPEMSGVRPYYKPVKLPPTAKEPKSEADPVAAWFAKRGISKNTLEAFGVLSDGPVAVFPYHTEDGISMLKFRDTSKAEKKIWASAETCPALFGWAVVPDDARSIILCEGEPDALAWYEQGHIALSVPFGAGTGAKHDWIATEYDRMERFDTIYLSMDMDKEGLAAREDLLKRLGNHRCRVVELPKKDANECLLAGLKLADYLATAKTVDPAELKGAEEYTQAVEEEFHPKGDGQQAGLPIPWNKYANLYFRPSETTIWTGISGHGKTMLLDHICVHGVALGERWLLASMEMRPPVHLKRLVSQATASAMPPEPLIRRAMEFFGGALWFFSVRGTAKADRLFEVAAYAVKRYGITQLVIDSLAKCGFDEDDYNGQKQFVDRLTDFAAEHRIHSHLVAHARKGEDESRQPGKMDVKGTGALTDMVDNVASVWRNKAKEDAYQAAELIGAPETKYAPQPDCIIYVSKQRNWDWEGKIGLRYDRACHQYFQDDQGKKEYVR